MPGPPARGSRCSAEPAPRTVEGTWGGFRDADWIHRIADPPESSTVLCLRNPASMSRPPRIKGFDYLGAYRYFVTFCTLERRAVFTDIALGRLVILQFRRS